MSESTQQEIEIECVRRYWRCKLLKSSTAITFNTWQHTLLWAAEQSKAYKELAFRSPRENQTKS